MRHLVHRPAISLRTAILRSVLVAVSALACVVLSSPKAVRAGQSCDTSEQVACIPLPADNPGPGTGTQSGGSATTSAPAAAAVPIPCNPGGASPALPCQPPPNGGCYPVPIAASPANAPAVAAPAPYSCSPYRSIYTTINLGNAADVRALRTLSTGGLYAYWHNDAFSLLQSQVDQLQSVGDYANTRLYSIQVRSATLNLLSSTADVRTLEHWLYQERASADNSLVYSQDEWVDNDYTLSSTNGSWYITADTITLTQGPIPVPAGG